MTNYDVATVRYSSAGNQLSVNRYNGSGNGIDRAVEIAIAPSAAATSTNVVVAGRTWNGTNYDILTLKYNGALAQQWVKVYAGNKDDEARDLLFDSSTGNIFITGNVGTKTHGLDMIALKYNASGVEQWVNTYNGAGNFNDIAYGIAVNPTSVSVTGRSAPAVIADTSDVTTITYDNSSGAQKWVSVYKSSGNGQDRGWSVTYDQFGNLYSTGETFGGSSQQDIVMIGYDSIGRIRWAAKYDGGSNADDISRVITRDKSGFVYIGGYATTSSAGFDAITLKYCPPPAVFAGVDSSICKGEAIQLSASGGLYYSWTPVTKLSNPIIPNPIANPASTTPYTVTVDNGLGCVGKDTIVVSVLPQPNTNLTANGPLAICQGDSVIFSVAPCNCTYQWIKGSNNISGATTTSFTAKAKGTYKVVVTNQYGCSKTSKGQQVTIVCKGEAIGSDVDGLIVSAAPNPSQSYFNIDWQSNSKEIVRVEVYNLLGTQVFMQQGQTSQIQFGSDFPAGNYLVKVSQGSVQKLLKVVKEK